MQETFQPSRSAEMELSLEKTSPRRRARSREDRDPQLTGLGAQLPCSCCVPGTGPDAGEREVIKMYFLSPETTSILGGATRSYDLL